MIKNPKISVIVPVYNSEKYLKKCLDSLIYQTYENIEIICIDDGSIDNSLEILNRYTVQDSRIRVISQKNGGASSTRNVGIDVSTGDYISFIDSDDWVYLTLYQTFVNAISSTENIIDIWMFNVAAYQKGENDIVQKRFFDSADWQKHTSDNVIHIFDDCMKPFSRNLSAANKIYRKNFINDISLRFPLGLKYEDQYFSVKAFLNAKSIMFTEDVFYRYRNYHENSVSCVISQQAFDIFQIMDLIENEINKLNVYESYKYALFQYKYRSFARMYMLCPEYLKSDYYNEMKTRLISAFNNNLDLKIAENLLDFKIFKEIMNGLDNG